MPKKKNAAATAPTKADFVRSLPTSTPAKDVVAMAKEAGISLKDDYVYKVRSAKSGKSAKKRPAAKKASPVAASPKKKAKSSRPASKAQPVKAASDGHGVAEFVRAVKRVGVGRAKELIATIEAYQSA